MELGVRSVSDPNEKAQMEGRIYNYREQLDSMREDMRSAESELSDKDKLFSGKLLFCYVLHVFFFFFFFFVRQNTC